MDLTHARIMVPLDGSETSDRALDVAIDLAHALGAELVLCNVIDLSKVALISGGQAQLVEESSEEVQAEGRRILDDGLQRVAKRVPALTRIVVGTPVDDIERLAGELEPAFIVMGTHGRTGFRRAILGSVTEGVARRAPAPVLIVPPERHEQ
ncbi:MAG: universal stress protein [Candidatus Cybelea sp.]